MNEHVKLQHDVLQAYARGVNNALGVLLIQRKINALVADEVREMIVDMAEEIVVEKDPLPGELSKLLTTVGRNMPGSNR